MVKKIKGIKEGSKIITKENMKKNEKIIKEKQIKNKSSKLHENIMKKRINVKIPQKEILKTKETKIKTRQRL